MTVQILRGDARHLPIEDGSVDLIVSSPPYWSLRAYQDNGETYDGQIGAEATPGEFVDALVECTREWMRVLKPSGSMWINLGDKYNAYNGNRGEGTIQANDVRQSAPRGNGLDVKDVKPKSLLGIPWRYAIRCIDDLGLILRAEVIWSKPNGLPESVTDRVRRSHEQWFHFTLNPRYYSAVDEVREEHVYPQDAGRPRKGYVGKSNAPAKYGNTGGDAALGKLPGSVWTVATEPLRVPDHLGIDHFAAFPTEWPRRIITGWSPEGGTVLDPFSGTGTTALVASTLGRHGIGVDMSSDYCRLAKWRTTDPKQRARAARKPWTPPAEQLPGQEALDFGGVV